MFKSKENASRIADGEDDAASDGEFHDDVDDFLHCELMSTDELFGSMAAGNKFSKIDFAKAYLQLEVHEDDQHLLTFKTHKGFYRPTRRMYGIASAPLIWQGFKKQLLADIRCVKVFLDDIKVTAEKDTVHLQRLDEVLRRLNSHGMLLP